MTGNDASWDHSCTTRRKSVGDELSGATDYDEKCWRARCIYVLLLRHVCIDRDDDVLASEILGKAEAQGRRHIPAGSLESHN